MADHADWTLIDRGERCGLYRHRDGRVAVLDIVALRYDRVHDARHPLRSLPAPTAGRVAT